MEKLKRAFVSLFLAALFAFAAIFGIADAKQHSSVSAADEEPKYTVGLCLSSPSDFYNEMINYLIKDLGKDYKVEVAYAGGDITHHITNINDFIGQSFNVLVVDPIEPAKISSCLWDAHREGIKIIVLGKPYDTYPPDISYVMQDFHQLGIDHLEWILHDRSAENIENICLYYDSTRTISGSEDYMPAFKQALLEAGLSDEILTLIDVNDLGDVASETQCWIERHPTQINNEMVTCFGDFAITILDTYYSFDYQNASTGEGTGIRGIPFPNIDQPAAVGYANAITGAATGAMGGTAPCSARSDEVSIDYVPFDSAYAQYVN